MKRSAIWLLRLLIVLAVAAVADFLLREQPRSQGESQEAAIALPVNSDQEHIKRIQNVPSPLDVKISETPSPAFQYLEQKPRSDGSYAIVWNFAATQNLQLGDSLRIALPLESQPRVAKVDSESRFEEIRSLTGTLEGADGLPTGRFSITLSTDARYVAASFTIDDGQYVLEAQGGAGTINDTANEGALLLEAEAAHR